MIQRLKSALRSFLGIDTDLAMLKQAVDADTIALGLELRALIDGHTALLEQYAGVLSENSKIALFHHDILKRWAAGSETLRSIEAKHKRAQEGGKILTLPSASVIGASN